MSRFHSPSTYLVRSFELVDSDLTRLEGWSGSTFETAAGATEALQSPAANLAADDARTSYLFLGEANDIATPLAIRDHQSGVNSLVIDVEVGDLVLVCVSLPATSVIGVNLGGLGMTALGTPGNSSTYKQQNFQRISTAAGSLTVSAASIDGLYTGDLYLTAFSISGSIGVRVEAADGHEASLFLSYAEMERGGFAIVTMTNGDTDGTAEINIPENGDTLTLYAADWNATPGEPPSTYGFVNVLAGADVNRQVELTKGGDINWAASLIKVSVIDPALLDRVGTAITLFARLDLTNEATLGENTETLTPALVNVRGVDTPALHEWEVEFVWRLRSFPPGVSAESTDPCWLFTPDPANLSIVPGVPGNGVDTYYGPLFAEITNLDEWITTTMRVRSLPNSTASYDYLGVLTGGEFADGQSRNLDGENKWPLQFAEIRVSGPYPPSNVFPELKTLGRTARGGFSG